VPYKKVQIEILILIELKNLKIMNRKYYILTAVIFFVLGYSQVSAQEIFEKWSALDEYHVIMSQTFHPAENDNLEAIKTKSGDLVEKANLLAKSPIPMEYNTEEIVATVKKLQKETKALDKLVSDKRSTDEQIKQGIMGLHDVFHEIVGLCRKDDH
tara:strand:+ start:150 stop:617 length:468 start_codon:yes stop_codon:yes gene_type:complete